MRLHLWLALLILLMANQCVDRKAHATTKIVLPSHYVVFELVLRLYGQRVPTGTAYSSYELCKQAAAEQNVSVNSAARFMCEPLIVLKE